MTSSIVPQNQPLLPVFESPFDHIKHTDENGIEYWSARELMTELEYTEWRNFSAVIKKSIIACDNGGNDSTRHFVSVNKMVSLFICIPSI